MQCFRLLPTLAAFALLNIWPTQTQAEPFLDEDQSKFSILAYSRIGEDHLPDQSLTRQQFDEHLTEIQDGDYNVLPLDNALAAIQENKPLPNNSIVLTFDGAYKSATEYAFPKLVAAQIPFTVFYASSTLDRKDPEYTDWKTLKKLGQNETVTIGTLPAVYDHITYGANTDILKSINTARQRYREEFETEADFLSYPYGEYSTEIQQTAQTQGYKAALGLHSGVAHSGSNLFALPRYTMTELFGGIDRFRMAARAMPLPIKDLVPTDMKLNDAAFKVGFTLPEKLDGPISCFVDGEQQQNLERLGQRVEIRPEDSLLDETRIRLNCTMQGPKTEDDEQTWRWVGLLYHRPPHTEEISIPQQDEPLPLQE